MLPYPFYATELFPFTSKDLDVTVYGTLSTRFGQRKVKNRAKRDT
jgi:hypothetical protein